MPRNTDGVCPYCSCVAFKSAATFQRTPEGTPQGEREWVNKCKGCECYSLHYETTGEQCPLVDPKDSSSPVDE